MKWCDEGIYLLASQPVDKCQSQDGAEAALQELERFLETGAENKIQELSKIFQDYEPILTKDLLVRGQIPGHSGGTGRGHFRTDAVPLPSHPTGVPASQQDLCSMPWPPSGPRFHQPLDAAGPQLLAPASCPQTPASHLLPWHPSPPQGRAGPTGVTVTLGAPLRCPAESSMPSPSTGACAEGLPEAGERGGDVPPQAGQPQEAGGQADSARAARGPPAGSTHQVALPLPRFEQHLSPQGMPPSVQPIV